MGSLESEEFGMRQLRWRAGCENGTCPNIYDTAGEQVAVQGTWVTDPATLAQIPNLPADEAVVLIPRALLLQYARKVLTGEAMT
jgi:hypothetical protein